MLLQQHIPGCMSEKVSVFHHPIGILAVWKISTLPDFCRSGENEVTNSETHMDLQQLGDGAVELV